MAISTTNIAGIIVAGVFLALQTAVPRLPVAERRLVPVEQFPQSVGRWTVHEDQKIDPDVLVKCPTAHLIQRIYDDGTGDGIQLLLMTATGADDIHDPNICFPSQGWVVNTEAPQTIAGQPVTIMQAQQNGVKMTTVYWYTAYYKPKLEPGSLVQRMSALRSHFVGTMEGMSLFVRIMAPNDVPRRQLEDFTKSVVPQVDAIVGPDGTQGA